MEHLQSELGLLLSVDHPFIIQMRGSFQDKMCVYLVMEYVPGGEFFCMLRDKGR